MLNMKWFRICICLTVCQNLIAFPSAANEWKPIAEWEFVPIYTLERHAKNAPGLNDRLIEPEQPLAAPVHQPTFRFFDELPTDARYDLLKGKPIPSKTFTIEAWFLHHVNQPVGTTIGPVWYDGDQLNGWFLGLYNRTFYFALRAESNDGKMTVLSKPVRRGFHKWLYHLVGTYDGSTMRFFINGELVAESSEQQGNVDFDPDTTFDVLAYMQNEMHMKTGDLLRNVWLYDEVFNESQIKDRFESVSQTALEGKFLRDDLHFTAGPILQMPKQNSMTILWETDRPTTAMVEYGTKHPMDQSIAVKDAKRLQEITLTNLEAATPYFYRIKVSDGESTIESGDLTFQTAVNDGEAVTFAVFADTESRPQISNQIAKQIWSERPHFMLINGDLTDSGKEPNRFEWVYEYFSSMTQLYSRIPCYPSIGNGESDQVWFTHYHALPKPENYYTFTYGNIQFFMLDTNQKVGPGTEQYEWLESELKRSNAEWKFACHHHPTYSADEDDYGFTYKGPTQFGDMEVQKLLPLYEQYEIDAVWYGHMHYYERTWPMRNGRVDRKNGVIHIQTGGAGGNFEEISPTRPWFNYSNQRQYHYCIVHIHQNHMEFKMVDIDGIVKDRFSITK